MRHWFRSHRFHFGVVLLAVTVFASGCVHGGRFISRDRDEPVFVTVRNNDFKDAVLYAAWDGRTRQRLGMVTGKTEHTFKLVRNGSTVLFQAHLIAGETITFDRMDASSGDHFDLVIMIQG